MIALVLTLALALPQAPASEVALARWVETRDSTAIREWCTERPELVHPRVKDRIDDWLANGSPEAGRAELVFLAAAVANLPTGPFLARILAWTPDERDAFLDLRAEVRAHSGTRAGARAGMQAADLAAAARELGADGLLLREYGLLANRLWTAGETELAFELVTHIGRESARVGDIWSQAWSEGWRGQISWQRGELAAAAAHLARAFELEALLGDVAFRVSLACDLARIELSRGQIDAGVLWTDRAEETARASGDDALVAESRLVRAGLHVDLREHEEALAISLALAPADLPDPTPTELLVRTDLVTAAALSDIGRFESAVTFAERALRHAEHPEVRAVAQLLELEARLTLGLFLGDVGRHAEGLAELERVRGQFAERGDLRGVAWTDKNLGWVLLEAGRRAEAAEALDSARAFGAETDEPYLEGLCALGVAEALALGATSLGELDTARVAAALRTADRSAERLNDLQLAWRAATVRGHVLELEGDAEGALAAFTRAVEGIERWRRRLVSPALLVHALRPRTDPYERAALAAARLGRDEEALRLTELLHARVLFEHGAATSRAPSGLEELRREIARHELQLHGERVADDELRSELRRLGAELDARLLQAELEAAGRPTGATPAGARPPAAPVTQMEPAAALARAGVDVVLDYLVGERATLLSVLDARGLRTRELRIGAAELELRIARLREPVERLRRGEVDLMHLDFDVAEARALAALLVPEELRAELPTNGVVAVVPDGPLTALPFELLVVGGALGSFDPGLPFAHLAGLRFLGDEQALLYLASLASLERARPWDDRRIGALLPPAEVGVLLAEDEAHAIATSFGSRLRVVREATPADLERLGRDAPGSALHLVAHGLLDRGAAPRGRLVLGGDEEPIATLAAARVRELAPASPLVVLSGCHTGEGRWLSGEGLLGLTRAFLASGSERVVASLWAVDDRTSVRFMSAFYAALAGDVDVVRALARARRSVRAELAHPYLWAGWVLAR